MLNDPSKPNFYEDRDAVSSIKTIKELLNSEAFNPVSGKNQNLVPSLTQVLIELSDVLQKAKNKGARISFKDDIPQAEKPTDITDLINTCRNAACHPSSPTRIFEKNKLNFSIVHNYLPNAMRVNGKYIGSDYADDIAFFWGGTRLYLNRHLIRALQEVETVFPDPWSSLSPPTNFVNR